MTREAALSLPAGPALDIVAAKVLRPWHIVTVEDVEARDHEPGFYPCLMVRDFGVTLVRSYTDESLWQPSTDDATALALLNRSASWDIAKEDWDGVAMYTVILDGSFDITLAAETLPHAIVRALLAAAGDAEWEGME